MANAHRLNPKDGWRACKAKRRDGAPCRQPAMKNQDVCRMHGGRSPQALQAAARRGTETGTRQVAHRMAEPRPVTPIDALEQELARCQGWVDWLEERIRERPGETAWVNAYQQERALLAKLAHSMIIARTDERRIVLTERTVEALDHALTGALHELGLNPESPHVRSVVGRHLQAIANPPKEGGTATGTDDDPSNVRPMPVRF